MTKTTNKQKLVNKLAKLVRAYDAFSQYIEDYNQLCSVEERNNAIAKEFADICTEHGIDADIYTCDIIAQDTCTIYAKQTVEEAIMEYITNYPKEDDTMKETTNTTATNNNVTTIKKEIIMTKKERIQDVARRIEQFTKTSDEGYVTKEEMAELIFDCMGGTKPNTKKYKRGQLIETVMIMAGKDKPQDSVSVGDLNITHDNTPAQQDNHDAKAKTDKLLALIKACATDNKKKGFGYTISSFMLQACILNAGAGIEKFKGHIVTEDEYKMTQNVYKWLSKNNYIKPIVYSVAENEKVRVYMDGYTGRTDSAKTQMIPYSKSKGYTAKKITSFLVTL